MTSQLQLSELQNSVNKLVQGNYDVLLDQPTAHIFPAAMMLMLENNRLQEFDDLLQQVASASRVIDKNLRQIASTCFVDTAKSLAITKYKNFERLEKMVPGLKTIAGSPVYPDQNRSAAKSILDKLESMQSVEKMSFPGGQPVAKNPLAKKEEQIFQIAKAGETEKAKNQLFDLVVSCAAKKEFANAERLRERIYEIDPTALSEMIRTGYIIEQGKGEVFCQDRKNTWANLSQNLTGKQFNCLYHSMEAKWLKDDETFVSQGSVNENLYFIDCGKVKISYTRGEKEFFLKHLGEGDLAGENFFHPSVWTVSLASVGSTRILILKRDQISVLEKKVPGIESKLMSFYQRTVDVSKMLRVKGLDRRTHDRFKFDRRIRVQVFDDWDNIVSNFNGETVDISQWGLSYVVRIASSENRRILLGRKIQIKIPVKSTKDIMLLSGTVIGLQPYDIVARDFLVHVKFLHEFDRRAIQAIMGEYHANIR